MDNLNELPSEKQPPELMIWDGTGEEIDSWIKQVMGGKRETVQEIYIKENEIE